MKRVGKPVAIVLGGTIPHGELLKKLKARGYYTILVDYFDNPPAAEFADEHSKESAMDYDAVLSIAKLRKAELVISSCLDQQMVIAIRVAEELGLPHPFSSEIALNVTNKKYMKKIMMEKNIPTARYYQVDEKTDLSNINLDYPIIVKPTDSCGSAGICKLESPEGLEEAVQHACEWSWTKEAIVEEYKQGIEVSVYAYVKDGKAKIVTNSHRLSVVEKDKIRYVCAIYPGAVSAKARENMEKIANQIAGAFGLVNTPLFYQSIVQGDDVYVIEFSPRLGGGVCYRLMQLNTDFDMLEVSIDSYLGIENLQKPKKENRYYFTHQLYAKDGTYDHIDGCDEMIRQGVIDEMFFLKTKGMSITHEKASSAKSAVMMISGETEQECFDKIEKASRFIEIRDVKGNPLLDRTLYLGKEFGGK